jgi:hypothetical protein
MNSDGHAGKPKWEFLERLQRLQKGSLCATCCGPIFVYHSFVEDTHLRLREATASLETVYYVPGLH